ncbi:MAG: hypothetical protein WCD27_08340 [Candidatus Acidiferrales bacterium]
MSATFEIRALHSLADFEQCVRVQRIVWGEDLVVPSAIFVVAHHTGGLSAAAFDAGRMIGFTLALAGRRDFASAQPGPPPVSVPLLHSHMAAVLPEYQNSGVGRRLKFFQREESLRQGIALIEWTFDPLELRNAHFNFNRLGAIARRYIPDCYGITESPLHAGLPTDRLVAEWWLDSPRVRNHAARDASPDLPTAASAYSGPAPAIERVTYPAHIRDSRSADPTAATRTQSEARDAFERLFSHGYAAVAVESRGDQVDYLLAPHSAIPGLRIPALAEVAGHEAGRL